MHKTVKYPSENEAIFIDGKFSTLMVHYHIPSTPSPTSYQPVKDIYFVHDGVLYKVLAVPHHFDQEDYELYRAGKIKEVLDTKSINGCKLEYTPCKSIKEAFIKMRSLGIKPKRTFIVIKCGDAVLIHIPMSRSIDALHVNQGRTHEVLKFKKDKFTYGYGSDWENRFDGFPDLDDSSTEMNLLLTGASPDNMRVLVDMYDQYTNKRKPLCSRK